MSSPSAHRRRLAFVTPRYGTQVVGGSEAVMREAAHGLADRGFEVEILTTCATDHYTWANVLAPGVEVIDDVTVRRFEVVRDVDPEDHRVYESALLAGTQLPAEDQVSWINGLFRVPSLHRHLVVRDDFDAVVLSPYLFWTTLAGALVDPDRSIVMPCLHDEPYARLPYVRETLARVRAHWYLSEPERHLASRLGAAARQSDVVGAGVDVPERHDPSAASAAIGRPFLLYAGRRESGKGWDVLVDAWVEARRRGCDIDLVSMGVGSCTVPSDVADSFHDLGFVDDEDAPGWFAAATAYVQPSRNESFSRTIMEAWLAGTPVLASRDSEVVAWHCERSGAGLLWSGRAQLTAAIELAATSPDALQGIAAGGREYVLAHYQWSAVLDQMEASLERFWCAG